MSVAERLLGRDKPRYVERLSPERMGNVLYLDRFRPTVKASHINEIDYGSFKERGVNTLLLDAEGTFVHQNGWDIDPKIVANIKSQNFDNIAIITNKKPKNEKEFLRLNHWAEQLGSEVVVFSPIDSSERKPASRMLMKAAAHFRIRPDEALVVGDKLTADILAANRAGMWSAKVDRLGFEDLPTDRVIRRPIEWGIGQRVNRDANSSLYLQPPESKAGNILIGMLDQVTYSAGDNKPDWVSVDNFPDTLWNRSRIMGYGRPDIVLPQEVQDAIPPGWTEVPGIREAKNAAKFIDQHVAEKFDELLGDYLYENGRNVAYNLTKIRRHGSWAVAGMILLKMPKAAAALHVLLSATDKLDGIAARRYKDGPTAEGGEYDEKTDKKYSRRVQAAEVLRDRLDPKEFLIREGRNIFMSKVVRPTYERSGHKVSAAPSGQAGTALINVGEFLAMVTNDSLWEDVFQEFATAVKVDSIPLSMKYWELKKADNDRYEEVREQMLQAA